MKKIRLIGNSGCSRCEVTKNILKDKKIDFEYMLLGDMTKEEQRNILENAKDKGVTSLPIIVVDNVVKSTIKEVL